MSAHYCARCLTTFDGDPERCTNLGCGSNRPGPGWGLVLEPGDLLDRHYRILRVLAVGGAGLTYLAREIGPDEQPVPPDLAIKVLYSARDSGPFLRRLSNEAQILQELAHKHIVECRGFVQRTGQTPYLVTLFEHGGSLTQHVERVGPLPAAIAAGVLAQVLGALDIAHQRAVVHRDLKPDNVLLHAQVPRGELPWIRVTDFGIAKVFGGVGDRLTRLGAFVGTPEYAAPEQFEGLTPTPATDVFAAGGLLFYLLTGNTPVTFTQRLDIEHSYEELLAQVPPRIPDAVGTPDERAILQSVLDHVMRREPGERWTIQQILSALDPILPPPPDTTPDPFHDVVPIARTIPDTPAPAPSSTPTLPPSEDGSRTAAEPRPPLPDARPDTRWEQLPPPPERTPPPPPPPVTRAPTPPPPPPPARSSARGILGVAGATVVLLGGGVAAVVVLLVAAWAFGWFSASQPDPGVVVPVPAVVVVPTEPVVLTDALDPARVMERRRIQEALDGAAGDLRVLCEHTGTVTLELVVEATGSVRSVAVDPRSLAGDKARCVEGAVGRMTVPRDLEHAAKVRLDVAL